MTLLRPLFCIILTSRYSGKLYWNEIFIIYYIDANKPQNYIMKGEDSNDLVNNFISIVTVEC